MEHLKPKALIVIILLTYVIIFLTSCSNNNEFTNENTFTDDTKNYLYIPQGNGLSYGIVSSDKKHTVDERTFTIKENQNLDLTLLVANISNQTKNYLIKPIIDYEEQEIEVNKVHTESSKVQLEGNKVAFIPVKLPRLSRGMHDILFLIIKEPDNTDTTKDYRANTELNHMVAIRISVVVEVDTIPVFHLTPPYVNEENSTLSGIFLSKDKKLKRWLVEKSTTNNINSMIQVGNIGVKPFPYAILALKDWKLVPLSNEKAVIFGQVEPGRRDIYQNQLSVRLDKKVTNYTTVLIPYPYQRVERFQPMDIEPSVRLAIVHN